LVGFGQSKGKIEAKFGQRGLDLGKIKILHPQEHSIPYSYVNVLVVCCVAINSIEVT